MHIHGLVQGMPPGAITVDLPWTESPDMVFENHPSDLLTLFYIRASSRPACSRLPLITTDETLSCNELMMSPQRHTTSIIP